MQNLSKGKREKKRDGVALNFEKKNDHLIGSGWEGALSLIIIRRKTFYV